MLDKSIKLKCLLLALLFVSIYGSVTKSAAAIIPQIQNVLVWESGGDVIVNVTVFHTPVSPPTHYVSKIEVNVSGTNHVFEFTQQTELFTFPCNIGPISGTPLAQVRAYCVFDLYSPWTDPIEIPEFQMPILLITLLLGTAFAAFVSLKIKDRRS